MTPEKKRGSIINKLEIRLSAKTGRTGRFANLLNSKNYKLSNRANQNLFYNYIKKLEIS